MLVASAAPTQFYETKLVMDADTSPARPISVFIIEDKDYKETIWSWL